jgi:hypothetical protein
MYKTGDDIFVVDNGRWHNKNEIVIQKRTFERYTTDSHEFLTFSGPTSMQIASWAVCSTYEEATKFTIAYIIKTECFNETINNMDVLKEYSFLEEHHPELILKYMTFVHNEKELSI